MKKILLVVLIVILIIFSCLVFIKLITQNSIVDKDGMIYHTNETNNKYEINENI